MKTWAEYAIGDVVGGRVVSRKVRRPYLLVLRCDRGHLARVDSSLADKACSRCPRDSWRKGGPKLRWKVGDRVGSRVICAKRGPHRVMRCQNGHEATAGNEARAAAPCQKCRVEKCAIDLCGVVVTHNELSQVFEISPDVIRRLAKQSGTDWRMLMAGIVKVMRDPRHNRKRVNSTAPAAHRSLASQSRSASTRRSPR